MIGNIIMSKLRYVTVWGILLLSGCTSSQPDLGDFEALVINKSLLDSLTQNRDRLSEYKEISDVSYLFGGIRLSEGGRTESSGPISSERQDTLLEVTDTIKIIYDPTMQRLIFKT